VDGHAHRPLVWSLTTGEAGLRQQARGLAQALSPDAQERVVGVGRLAALAPPSLFSLTLAGVTPVEGSLAPPWPDILVSCGRRAGLAAMAIRRRSGKPMVTIHIQRPTAPHAFDLVVGMPHDRLSGDNVIQVDSALHGLDANTLAGAAARGDSRFADLPRPWTAVLVGGPTGKTPFSVDEAKRLADGLDALRARIGGSLLITPSRRTPPAVLATLGARYAADRTAFIWDGGGDNPYLAMLAGADAVVVTSDSISMMSEALATTADLWVFELEAGRRHAQFLQALLDKGLAARLGEAPPGKRREGIDATQRVAAAVRVLVWTKLGLPACAPP
jgi:mitochondrial fission protein ELM1